MITDVAMISINIILLNFHKLFILPVLDFGSSDVYIIHVKYFPSLWCLDLEVCFFFSLSQVCCF